MIMAGLCAQLQCPAPANPTVLDPSSMAPKGKKGNPDSKDRAASVAPGPVMNISTSWHILVGPGPCAPMCHEPLWDAITDGLEGISRTSRAEGKVLEQACPGSLQAIREVVSDKSMQEFLQADLSTVHVATVWHRPRPKAHRVLDIIDPDMAKGMSATCWSGPYLINTASHAHCRR